MDEKTVVKKIQSWRWRIAKAGLTQRDFCNDIEGLTESNLSQYILLQKKPRVLTFSKIEKRLEELGV